MEAVTVESLIESSPHPTIPHITGMTTYEFITDVIRPLNENTASIHSKLGGGHLEHLALTIYPAVYTMISATPLLSPANPGTTPVITGNPLADRTNKIIRYHKESLCIWCEYKSVDGALK